jgi:3-polyprenyl-4-hydroxybenzoate decarboxylase
LPEKVAKSVAERAPVVVLEARPREMPLHAIESPFAAPEIRLTLLLKVFQSTQVIAPVVVEFAIFIPNIPVKLL